MGRDAIAVFDSNTPQQYKDAICSECEKLDIQFLDSRRISSLRAHVLLHPPLCIYSDCRNPTLFLELQGVKVHLVWDLNWLSDESARRSIENDQPLKGEFTKALSSAGCLLLTSVDVAFWLEQAFGVSSQIGLSFADALSRGSGRTLIGVGAGLGNILQTGPCIRKVAEFLGHPVDVYIDSFTHEAVHLLGRSPWTNMVYGDSALACLKHYDSVFVTYNAGHLIPGFFADSVVVQRNKYLMNVECKNIHETEYTFLGLEDLFPGFEYTREDTQRYFVGDLCYKNPQNQVVGICSGFKPGVWERRSWAGFGELSSALSAAGYEVRSFGTSNEYVPGTVDCTGTTIRQNLEDLCECSYFVASDGGIYHMAEALGVPTVVLFGPTGIIKNGPVKPWTRVVHSGLNCSPCNFKIDFQLCEQNDCMSSITVEQVLAEFNSLADQIVSPSDAKTNSALDKLAAIHDHERLNQSQQYRDDYQDSYQAKSFQGYPQLPEFYLAAIEGNVHFGDYARASEILCEARKLCPENDRFNCSLEAFICKESNSQERLVQFACSQAKGFGDYQLIDVYMTTYRRPELLAQTLPALMEACARSRFDHRIHVLVDGADSESLNVLRPFESDLGLVTSPQGLGLPFMHNLMLEHNALMSARSERFADLLCYIQDDVLIEYPESYFDVLARAHAETLAPNKMGFVSGYYTPIHPGYAVRVQEDYTVLLSDSIDGKNIVGSPSLFHSVGPLTWYFPNGDRRGNPGPKRGSHFDLWQWLESPNATTKQGRSNVIVPGLCRTIATSAEESTWNNPSDSQERIAQRIAEGRIYDTRKKNLVLSNEHYFHTSRA